MGLANADESKSLHNILNRLGGFSCMREILYYYNLHCRSIHGSIIFVVEVFMVEVLWDLVNMGCRSIHGRNPGLITSERGA